MRHRSVEQGGAKRRRKSGREESNKQQVNDCRISALKWKGFKKKKKKKRKGRREREKERNPCCGE